MDFTGKYLMMCKKASLLQENIKTLLPNAFGALYMNENTKISIHKKKNPEDLDDAGMTWLPRVDEMVSILNWNDTKYVHEMQKCFDNGRDFPFIKSLGTLEKMTLSVVMFHKFGMEWDDEELKWVDVRMYGIGFPDNDSWAMVHGPTRNLKDLVDNCHINERMYEDSPEWHIINLGTNKKLYNWDKNKDEWVLND